MLDAVLWLIQNIAMAFYNLGYALTHPGLWLDWSNKEAIMRFVYYGGSVEFFFVVFTAFLVITGIGVWKRAFLWGCVRALEGFANTVGRFFAWAGLIMVIQQIIIVFMQRIFARPDIVLGFGIPLQFDISWWAEELKLYNAMIVALCCTYTFRSGQPCAGRSDLCTGAARHQEGDRHVRLARLHDADGGADMDVWLVLHVAAPDHAKPVGLGHAWTGCCSRRGRCAGMSRPSASAPTASTAYFLFKVLLVAFAGHDLSAGLRVFLALLAGVEGRAREPEQTSRQATRWARAKKPMKARIKGTVGHAIRT